MAPLHFSFLELVLCLRQKCHNPWEDCFLGGGFHAFLSQWCFLLHLLRWGMVFSHSWLLLMEFLCPQAIRALEFLFSRIRFGSSWCYPAKDFTGFELGSYFSGVFFGEFLTWFFFVWFSFCGVRSAQFGWFSQDTHLSMVVDGFFRSSNLQPRPCRFFTLGVWPTCARGVSPWIGACGSRLVFEGEIGGFSVVPRSFG
jgi:hypothetical protein